MSIRIALPALVSVGAFMACASPALAQPVIDYDTGVTQTVSAEPAPLPAERIIPQRQSGTVPVFVPQAVVQGTAPDGATGAHLPPAGATPVLYTYPLQPQAPYAYGNAGAQQVIYPTGMVPAPYQQAPNPQTYAATAPLPAGSQIVTFDRTTWLDACRSRLAAYKDDDRREAAMGALGGAAAGHIPGLDRCEAYLDSYMASVSAGTLSSQPQYGQQYMLVPVTVMVPQMPSRQ